MNKPQFSAVFYFLKQHKLIYGILLVITLLGSVLESFSVVAFFPIFSTALGESPAGSGGLLGFVNGTAQRLPFHDPIIASSILLIGIFLVKTVFTLLRELLTAYASAKVIYNVKKQVMDRYAAADYQFFLDNKQGALFYNGLTAPNAIGATLLLGPQAVSFSLKCVAISVVMIFVLPIAALLIIGLGLLYYLFIHYLSKRFSFNLGRGKSIAGTEQTVIANEFLSGIRQIVTFGTTNKWITLFDRANRTFRDLHVKQTAWLATPRPLMEFIAIVLIVVIIVTTRLAAPGNFATTLPLLGVFAIAMIQMLTALTAFGRLRMEFMGALPDAYLAYQTVSGPVPLRGNGTIPLERFSGPLAFENVCFSHKGRNTLLNAVNITFDKGTVTAVVGPSGAGKTTIINLILGLFRPTQGRITVDQIPLEDIQQETWLTKIGFVSQDPFIFHATVTDNITFGREGYASESIVEAAKIANAHGFISELPEGYDTIVGDRGMRLSGGQQQRLAIARAVLGSPSILIFDEATSSLDNISERLVQEAIDNVSKDRTVIIVAHRLSTIRFADKIIVLENGAIIEEGTHQELLDKRGHYAQLVSSPN